MHVLNHKGKYLSVRGPLNIARPVQGWPVIVQAGASEAGRQLAAETAEVIFAAGGNLDGRAGVLRRRQRPDGRSSAAIRDHLKILPGAFVVVGDTRRGSARRSAPSSTAWCTTTAASPRCSIMLGHDVSGFDPDGPLPEIPESNASQERPRADRRSSARRENLTVRQLAQRVGGYGGAGLRRHAGRPSPTRWRNGWTSDACDGFNVMFPYLPGGLDDFVDQVVPELQRAASSGANTRAATLRENLGLPRPANRFFEG